MQYHTYIDVLQTYEICHIKPCLIPHLYLLCLIDTWSYREFVKFSGYFLCLMTSHDPWEFLATSGMASHHRGGGKIPAPGETAGDDSEMMGDEDGGDA